MRRFLKNKRGFTIAETVISLAVITIISIGTISLMQASNKSLRRATYNAQAQNFVADVVACYRVGELDESSIGFAGGEGTKIMQEDGKYVCILPRSEYRALIEVVASTMTVKVYNISNTTLVAQASFTKGGAST